MTRSELAPGVEVVTVPGAGLALRDADGAFWRIDTGDVPAGTLLTRLGGRESGRESGRAPQNGAGTPDGGGAGGELDALCAAFASAGYLGAAASPRDWPRHLRDVRLLGAPALTGPLATCLRAAGATVSLDTEPPPPAPPGPGTPAAVVWCLDGPVPTGLWDAADALPARGTAWLRCHREGHQMWIEPLAAAPGDVTSAHVRARRLAATPAHRELAAYWDGRRTTGAPATPGPAQAAFVAALMAADLTAWATGARTPGLPPARRLRRVDLRTLTVTEHPVLPVPPVAPLPAPRTPGAA
ncbi:hypothetical protein V1J52_01420 [Streptomyces sp. TRM 70351]|uniref:hypothetical protein n=1 Tax=Streptomyces sp. TRM 70351 TaxID=3116552 RepID=UPI002E7BBAE9|nr:hypothetical protein [Streptomyces sp. TRM 70351]MEE1926854.1 hypothetical protein [Streptomyces sp. TRM 70351]